MADLLSGSDVESDVENDTQITVNEHFAKAYAYRKEREELQKLKDKYGSDVEEEDADSEDSEENESEDEDGEELTPAVDAAILRTLARIKRKDPDIYDAKASVFEEERQKLGTSQPTVRKAAKDKSKPLTIRKQAIDSVLANGADGATSRSPSPQPLTHVEEQRALRDETISAFHRAVSGDEAEGDSGDELLVPREKTKDELEREEEEYQAFLKREVGVDLKELITVERGEGDVVVKVEDEEEGKKKKKKKGKKERKEEQVNGRPKSKEEEDQEFLMNYILNRGWIDRSSGRVPTYKEVVSTKAALSDNEEAAEGAGPPEEEDEEFEDVLDHFESSYNFRFEEPDAAEIKRYPRNITSTARREDTSRKEAREKRKARKEAQRQQKLEEIRRLKSLKSKELRAKLERIGREGGAAAQEEALEALDLEGEWDPAAHDAQMADIYGGEDGEDEEWEGGKPTWEDDIDIGDIVPEEGEGQKSGKKKKKKKGKGGEEGGEGVDVDMMDADAPQPALDELEWDGTEEMRKRVLDQYMDEIYGLEFNDMVGDMPTRFHYTRVAPENFALTPAEILLADDAELNSYVGLRKLAPYRERRAEKWDSKRNERLAELRSAIANRRGEMWGAEGWDQEADGQQKKKKRKGKKERERERAEKGAVEEAEAAEEVVGLEGEAGDDGPATKKRKRKHKKSQGVS